MSGENISPRRTRSGLVICSSSNSGEGETSGSPEQGLRARTVVPRLTTGSPELGLRARTVVPRLTPGSPEQGLRARTVVPRLTPGSPELGLGARTVVSPRLSLLGRGHGTGREQRGVEVVGRPAPQQRVGAAQEEDGPEVIDLSDDDGVPGNPEPVSPIGAAFLEMQNISRAEANLPVTPQARSLMDITIDLTMSPVTSAIDPSPSGSTIPPSSPSLPSIMCPVCMESINSIRMKGYHLLSTVCGHIFCSHCLPECIRLSPTCPPAGGGCPPGITTSSTCTRRQP